MRSSDWAGRLEEERDVSVEIVECWSAATSGGDNERGKQAVMEVCMYRGE